MKWRPNTFMSNELEVGTLHVEFLNRYILPKYIHTNKIYV